MINALNSFFTINFKFYIKAVRYCFVSKNFELTSKELQFRMSILKFLIGLAIKFTQTQRGVQKNENLLKLFRQFIKRIFYDNRHFVSR